MRYSSRAGRWAIGIAAASLALAACSSGDSSSAGSDKSVDVGLLLSYSGPFANWGPAFENGFRAGLDSLTHGTNKVNGVKINIEVKDDTSDPATGASAAKELLGKGVDVIAGTNSSAVIAQVAELVRQNDRVLITGNTAGVTLPGYGKSLYMTLPPSTTINNAILKDVQESGGKKIAYIGQDYAFGQQASAALATQAKPYGIDVKPVLLPVSTQDFTAGVTTALAGGTDTIDIGWAGQGLTQVFQSLADAGVFDADSKVRVVTNAPPPEFFDGIAAAVGEQNLNRVEAFSYYAPGTTGTDAEKVLLEHEKKGVPIGLDQASGYLAAEMLVKGIEDNGANLTPEGMHKSLADQVFSPPQGDITFRGDDHVVLTDVNIYTLEKSGSTFKLALKSSLDAKAVALPVTKKSS